MLSPIISALLPPPRRHRGIVAPCCHRQRHAIGVSVARFLRPRWSTVSVMPDLSTDAALRQIDEDKGFPRERKDARIQRIADGESLHRPLPVAVSKVTPVDALVGCLASHRATNRRTDRD
jgi:hypothetical protein